MMENFARLKVGAMWSSAATVSSMVATFASTIIAARILGVNVFGAYSLALSAISALGTVTGIWLSTISVKLIAEEIPKGYEKIGQRAVIIVCFSLAASAFVLLLAHMYSSYAASFLFAKSESTLEIYIIACALGAMSVDAATSGILIGLEAWTVVGKIAVTRGIVLVIAMLSLSLKMGLVGAIGASLCAYSVSALAAIFYIKRIINVEGGSIFTKIEFAEVKYFFVQSAPAFLGSAIGAPVLFVLNKFLMSQPNGVAEVGFFAAAFQWKNAILFIPRRFGAAALPIMAQKNHHAGEITEMARGIAVLATFPVVVLLSSNAEYIFSFYGPGFSEKSFLLSGVLLVAGVSAIGAGVASAIIALNKLWFGFLTNLLNVLVLVVVSWFAIPLYGANGLILGYVVSSIVNLLFTYWVLRAGLLASGFYGAVMSTAVIVLLVGITCIPHLNGIIESALLSVLSGIVSYRFLLSSKTRKEVSVVFGEVYRKIITKLSWAKT